MKRAFLAAVFAIAPWVAHGGTITASQAVPAPSVTGGEVWFCDKGSPVATYGCSAAQVAALATASSMQRDNNGTDIASPSAFRGNLGLGSAATMNTGTAGAVVPLLNSSLTFSGTDTFQGIVTGGTGSAQTNVGQSLAWSDAGPNWASYSTLHDSHRFDTGGFPVSSEVGNNVSPITQTLVGTVKVPSSALGGNAAVGVAGYGMTSSNSVGAVGLFGQCGITVGGSTLSCWASNVLIANCATPSFCGPNTGFDPAVLYGLEIDTNIAANVSAFAPDNAVRGIYFQGASAVQPTNAIVAAIDIDAMGPGVPWKDGIRFEDGATSGTAGAAINLGVNSTANNHGSQEITVTGRDTGGTKHTALFWADANGDGIIQGAPGAAGEVNSNGACIIAALPTTDTLGCLIILSGPLRMTPTTVAGLATFDPTPSDGDMAYVTDATSPTFNGALTGGSTVHTRVHYDGSSSSWRAG